MNVKELVSATLTPVAKAAIQTDIQDIVSKLPFLISLTEDERHGGLKLGDKTEAFMQKAFEYAANNPTWVPSYVNMTDAAKDYTLFIDLMNILQLLLPLLQQIDDTKMQVGAEAYSPCLLFYNCVRMAAEQDVPGARTAYEDMQSRFPGRPKKVVVPPFNPPTPTPVTH